LQKGSGWERFDYLAAHRVSVKKMLSEFQVLPKVGVSSRLIG
jgi:hypothetical protein